MAATLTILQYANLICTGAMGAMVVLTALAYVSGELATTINLFIHWLDSRK